MTIITDMIDSAGFLPRKVTEVPRDVILSFQHSKKVGNYLLGKSIGEGSFAKVKEAMHILTGEKVAVKIIDKRKAKEDSYVRKNLRREGKILQMVRHPNVVQLLEIMETENSYYLVMEYCKGGDLMDYICQRKKLEEREAKRFIRQVISALDYLHRMGILHSNKIKVVTTKDGVRAQEHLVTQCGSPAYAAPELLGRKKYGPQVDVWSIGVNMFAMLTGNLPFTVQPFNIKVLHNKMIAGQMNPVPDTISRDCRDLIRKLLTRTQIKRITLTDAMKHPWIAEVFPNRRKDELDETILKHMSEVQGFRLGEVIRFVTGNLPSPALSMYHTLDQRLKRYYADMRVRGKMSALESYSNRAGQAFQTYQKTKKKKQTVHTDGVLSNIEKDLTIVEIDENANHINIRVCDPVKAGKGKENEQEGKENQQKPNIDTTGEIKEQTEKKVLMPKLAQKCTVLDRNTQQNGATISRSSSPVKERCESPTKSRRGSLTKPILSPRKVNPKAQTDLGLSKDKTNKNDNCRTYSAQAGFKRFQRLSVDGSRNTQYDLNGRFIRKTEVKIVNNKKKIDLIYSTTSDNSSDNSSKLSCHSPTLSERFNSPIVEQTKMFLRAKHNNGNIKTGISKDQSKDDNSIEEISPISSPSKQMSSRATTRTDLSSFAKDGHIALPCITAVHRNS
ncbi:Hormonally up-regulated neu tumor-associated kinase,Serine/threonine-protein kinase MARK1,Serine/threonine protein kinase OSK4,MAP/microtubule affinity-regulating kinase 4,SNF1-related protein kinase catalytic subunit alpha KIN11,Serine/threonine protein kinase OSK3,Hormonally up-regulated neu tumor-associated kinase homolog,Serine/threonine-protein kinase MARK2,Hormonally up-regulated neu tumor-associated kinase homolog B,MAP/microtubule affinity-regulating kinase 3,Hormonally up-regulated neu tumor-assoc|uniref:non-specific serine/threonine protein kinase n=1 Tax=Mytilus edulis TaxID=6550 RepID=A0A8S3VJV8_MYTED|nr:Hormonally up-regulated neu tumor-associated kinase,Serine/threonine-protein kinase MARK1,Serine/threonine protein kinase OSK4,MAP/microtubule affinity-regulating kinase 4,SNF1-related protein kinase catalytic subunit alpha KIN11,Serine/threonine protein kinase OSK3,Hormonally up-regulated neu tumor-associated kinase homolog,Serine/threonine-protein kinase MARK2,Hormonally up-regulated neu tumor-associated kinase homolog B,MAP/microtubule affinity-regulating kinase 3,Hormonally up-regulated neu 